MVSHDHSAHSRLYPGVYARVLRRRKACTVDLPLQWHFIIAATNGCRPTVRPTAAACRINAANPCLLPINLPTMSLNIPCHTPLFLSKGMFPVSTLGLLSFNDLWTIYGRVHLVQLCRWWLSVLYIPNNRYSDIKSLSYQMDLLPFENRMQANPEKFKSMMISRDDDNTQSPNLNKNTFIIFENPAKILGAVIDSKLFSSLYVSSHVSSMPWGPFY